jgi:hypothetical protein
MKWSNTKNYVRILLSVLLFKYYYVFQSRATIYVISTVCQALHPPPWFYTQGMFSVKLTLYKMSEAKTLKTIPFSMTIRVYYQNHSVELNF